MAKPCNRELYHPKNRADRFASVTFRGCSSPPGTKVEQLHYLESDGRSGVCFWLFDGENIEYSDSLSLPLGKQFIVHLFEREGDWVSGGGEMREA